VLAGIIGHPLGHSLSPVIHNAGFAALGLDVSYEAWPTPPEELAAAVQRLHGPDYLGMSVTIPHKQAIMPLLDAIDPAAAAIGSVNTVAKREGRLIGHNTDKEGFLRPLRKAGCDPAGLRALVLGVGGSERAIAYGLVEAGVAAITLAGRRPDRVDAAAAHLAASAPGRAEIHRLAWQPEALIAAAAEAGIVVNCTPIGMRHTAEEHESPLPAAALRPELWVYDIVYNPLETDLLRLARAAGARVIAGLEMLVYQAAAQQALWTGREPPVDIMLKAAEVALAARE
jgi:shikimate dehydrogenase